MAVFLKKKTFVCTHDHPKSSIVKSPLNLTVVSFGQSSHPSPPRIGSRPKMMGNPGIPPKFAETPLIAETFQGGLQS